MQRALAAVLAVTVAAAPAMAEPHKLLILQAEGHADAATRSSIDAAILKLARSGDAQASAGDISFSEAAAAVGCKAEDRKCQDEIIGMLGVDEIVFTTVTSQPAGVEIIVHRVTRGSASREAQMVLGSGQPADRLDGIAPLFGVIISPPVTPAEPTTPAPALAPAPVALAEPAAVEPNAASLPMREEPDSHTRRRQLEIAGMAAGGTMVLVGFILWGQASSLQSQIDAAPVRSHAELEHVADLERRGDGFAAWGNAMWLGGVVIGTISGVLWWKDRRGQRSRSARITPMLSAHGAGIAFSFGSNP